MGWKVAKHIFLRGKKGSFDQQQITMAAIALTKREIPLNGELMSHYWPSITDNSTIAGVENIFNIHHAVQIKRKPHQYVHYHNATIIDNSTIVNVKLFSISMMQPRSEWNLRSFKFWGVGCTSWSSSSSWVTCGRVGFNGIVRRRRRQETGFSSRPFSPT